MNRILPALPVIGVSHLLASLGHTGKIKVVLGHTLNTLRHIITHKKSHNAISKFTILCWAVFIAILGCMRPVGLRLDTPGRRYSIYKGLKISENTIY